MPPQEMAFSARKAVYDLYARGGSSWVRRVHRAWFRSPRTARWVFGMDVEPAPEGAFYYDLTTVLLHRLLVPRVRRDPGQKILEIGVGAFAILAGSLARIADHPVDAVELDPARVASSRHHAQLNNVRVNVTESDLLSALPQREYDLVFWNLPYYRDPSGYLAGLFRQIPAYLSERGRLLIGYNSKPLPRARVLELLEAQPSLRLVEAHTWKWNLHEVLELGRTSAHGS
jgi:protein-L-isoaspartate O-methyltransferase